MMKNIKKLILLCGLIISGQFVFGEKKDVVYIINNYGEDIFVNLNWYPKPSSWSFLGSNQEFIVNEFDSYDSAFNREEFIDKYQHKSPYSKYYLTTIKVTPAINKLGQAQMAGTAMSSAANQGYAVLQPLNEATVTFDKPNKSSLVFVIEKSDRKSPVSGQNQIKIMKFLSRESYQQYLERSQQSSMYSMPMVSMQQPVTSIMIHKPINQDVLQQEHAYELEQEDRSDESFYAE